jgi:hypothetical protein
MSVHSRTRSVIRFAWLVSVLLLPTRLAAQESAPALGEKEAAIEAALDQETLLNFVDQPLSDVVAFLRAKHEIQIELDAKALADAGVGSDTTVNRHLHDIALRSALDLLLGEYDLTYVIRDEVLVITTKTEAENIHLTRVYPVADLVLPRDDDLVVGYGADFTSLIELVTTSVGQSTWDEVGGPGTIKEHRNSLTVVISQTDAVHRGIRALFESLRTVDRRQAEQRRDAQALVAHNEGGLQLKVYKLPPKPQIGFIPSTGFGPTRTAPAVAPSAPNAPATVQPQMGGMGGMRAAATTHPSDTELQKLAEVIESVIEPASWQDSGGEGVIRAVNGVLVVRQTDEVHRQIRRLLRAL